jgi:hypothetical protein
MRQALRKNPLETTQELILKPFQQEPTCFDHRMNCPSLPLHLDKRPYHGKAKRSGVALTCGG